jgi:cellobiose transport system substrate-binding protein
MRVAHRRSTALAAAGIAAALLTTVTGCGDGSTPAAGTAKVTLTVATFGDFGYQPLYAEYQQLHKNVEIVERITKLEDHHKNLAARLATNTGAADIEAIEEGWIGAFTAQPSRFHHYDEYGAADVKSRWPDWKWQAGTAKDGSVIGLGTDVGGMAMCYRRDLFERAGLPADRDAVSKLWPTWQEYIAAGERFMAAKLPDAHWFDGPIVMYKSILAQGELGVYDKNDNVVIETNPAVKQAWDLTIQAIRAGLSAKITAWTTDWNAGMANGTYATLGCPSWMMGYIQEQAKQTSGKWDIASIPGSGGNWGGSWLTLPKQGKHPREAAELAKWLTAPEQQVKVFRAKGNFPSTVSLYEDAVIKDFSNPFFNNAPVGTIYSTSVKTLVPQYQGPKTADINMAIQNGLTRIEQGKQNPEQAWAQVLTDVKALQ